MARGKKYTYGMLYRSAPNEKGEWFAVGVTEGKNINLWHLAKGLTRVYTFKGIPGVYDDKTFWHEKLCKEILADLMSPKPTLEVQRFLVNGQVLFSLHSGVEKQPMPRAPQPLTEEQAVRQREFEANRLEEQRMLREDPAPMILYGKHPKYWKEYAWKLFPDKPYRQEIEIGKYVMAHSENGPVKIRVTRIEEAGDKEQPTGWVIHKIVRRPKPVQVSEEAQEASESDSVNREE